MFKKRNIRPSTIHHSDQLPFLTQKRFSALPRFRPIHKDEAGLSLLIALLYIIDLFGVFPLVTLPGVFITLGIFAIPLVLIVVGLQIYTALLLGKCWIIAEALDPEISQKSRYPYAAISDMVYGKHISLIVTILLDLSIFATGIPSLVVASQNLQLIGHRISDGHFYFSFCYWLVIIGILICPLMWFGSPKNMRVLAVVSVVVVSSAIILLWYCLLKAEGTRKPFYDITTEFPPFFSILGGYSILAFQFDIHSMLLTIQVDMKHKEQIKWASVGGILCTIFFVIVTALIAAYKFGSMVTPNILQMLPRSVPLYLAILLISLQLCLSSVVGSSALFLHVENYFRVPENFSRKRVIIRSTLIGLEVLLGEFVPKFDVLIGIIGGTITGPLIFILPPLLYRKIRQMEKVRNRIIKQAAYGSLPIDLNYESMDSVRDSSPVTKWTAAWQRIRRLYRSVPCKWSVTSFVVGFGVLASVSCTYLNLLRVGELFQNNSPCFGNISDSYTNL